MVVAGFSVWSNVIGLSTAFDQTVNHHQNIAWPKRLLRLLHFYVHIDYGHSHFRIVVEASHAPVLLR